MIINAALKKRVLDRCFKIYEGRQSLQPVYEFLDRLHTLRGENDSLLADFWEDVLIPEIKKRYFSGVTVDVLIQQCIQRYRSVPDSALALLEVWESFDWKYPFATSEYSEFQEQLSQLLAKEESAPTKADWDALNEWLMK